MRFRSSEKSWVSAVRLYYKHFTPSGVKTTLNAGKSGPDFRYRRTLCRETHCVNLSPAVSVRTENYMAQPFSPGDYLTFQLESGYGLLRILAVQGEGPERLWHIAVYEELFPDVDEAEKALAHPESLHYSKPHLALTERAFERTPAARLGNAVLTETDLSAYRAWLKNADRATFDRSLLLLLGMR
ncbi:MAG: hypothetical protein JWM21_2050 [Acidobacteria bacterium]|nr:hypothetical protein [Acidobacteriota bacterium]